ncbi:MAG: carboxypeptidase-like regulatory domain-containing protein [Clostridiales bacterium]|nr:carboxypeptidase-like regulatory domain-containing protein [Clostridiales bacterium]MCF8022252.1 carboxypeptidase-like regulatory domain-containing protein [Clostridiales bacterium]
MTDAKKIRQEIKKRFNWYSSIFLPEGIVEPHVYARVQSLRSQLLETSLRVDVNLRLFVVASIDQDIVSENAKPGTRKTKDVETTSFIKLPNMDKSRSIKSIRHEVEVKKVSYRGDRVSIIGSMILIVSYLSTVMLDGTVIEFLKGNPVKGAKVEVKDIDTNELVATTSTGANGDYAFSELNPGTYLVEVIADDFQIEKSVAVVMLKDKVDFTLHKYV